MTKFRVFLSVALFVCAQGQAIAKAKYGRDYLEKRIKSYPCEGLLVRNLTEMFKDPGLNRNIVNRFAKIIKVLNPDYIAAPEARALPTFGALTYRLNKPGIFIRKAGKLPKGTPKLVEYYENALRPDNGIEMSLDEDLKGKTVVIIDDGISSGGTTLATIKLLERAGMRVIRVLAVVEYHYRERVEAYKPWNALTDTLFDL